MRAPLFAAALALAVAGCVTDDGYSGSGYGYGSQPSYGYGSQPSYGYGSQPSYGYGYGPGYRSNPSYAYNRDNDISWRRARRIADQAIEQRLGRDFEITKIDEADREGRYLIVTGEGRPAGRRGEKDFRVVVDRRTDRVVEVWVEDMTGRRRR